MNLVLIESRLGGGPGLQYEPDLILYTQTGDLSAEGRRIYHLQECFVYGRYPISCADTHRNLNDISPRCARTLAEADFIAAEDTRVSLKLLNHLEII